MLRLLAFVVLALVLTSVLGHVPIIGPFFHRTGFIGVWITAMLLAWGFTRWGQWAVRARRDRAAVRQLQAVESPHNRGKLGSLYLAQGRAAKALPELEQAVAGEPEVAEWHYRLGSALLDLRRVDEAIERLTTAVAIDEEHAYGAAQLRLAQALSAAGRHEEALDALATFERNHGPSPESAYRRGLAHKRLGARDQARRAFAEVSKLASEAARYQRREAEMWRLKARIASL